MAAVADVRPSPIVGRWYPREPGRLARSVDAYLDSARLADLGGTVAADRVRIPRHATSGDVTGEREEVVGYGAAVVIRRARAAGGKRGETR